MHLYTSDERRALFHLYETSRPVRGASKATNYKMNKQIQRSVVPRFQGVIVWGCNHCYRVPVFVLSVKQKFFSFFKFSYMLVKGCCQGEKVKRNDMNGKASFK